MYRVSVFYPAGAGKRFDHEYYANQHMPLAGRLLRPIYYEVDQGRGGRTPGSPPPFVAGCHFYFSRLEDFQTAIGVHGAELMADIPAYTDIAPEIQISEILAR